MPVRPPPRDPNCLLALPGQSGRLRVQALQRGWCQGRLRFLLDGRHLRADGGDELLDIKDRCSLTSVETEGVRLGMMVGSENGCGMSGQYAACVRYIDRKGVWGVDER